MRILIHQQAEVYIKKRIMRREKERVRERLDEKRRRRD